MICKILFSFSVPLDPVQIEVLKEKEKEEREKWSFWPKQPLISQLFRNKMMTKIENLIAVTNKDVWTNWNRNWKIATIGKLGLQVMDAIVLQIQWEYCFTVSTNSLCQYLWNSVRVYWFVYQLKHWFWNLFEIWLHFPKFEEILSNAKEKQSGREAPEVYCVRAPSWIMSCFLFLHEVDKLWHSFQVCGDDNCSKWEQSNQTQR